MKSAEINKTRPFLNKRIESFRNAFSGLAEIAGSEPNMRIHLAILLLVIISGIALNISLSDWIAITLVSGLVLVAECFNTALEYLSDTIIPDHNPGIKKAKDIAAAGVLISAFVAAVTGMIVFIPEIVRFLSLSH